MCIAPSKWRKLWERAGRYGGSLVEKAVEPTNEDLGKMAKQGTRFSDESQPKTPKNGQNIGMEFCLQKNCQWHGRIWSYAEQSWNLSTTVVAPYVKML